MESFLSFDTLKHYLINYFWSFIRTFLFIVIMYSINYIVTSMTLYRIAKNEGRTNAFWSWIPGFRDILTIELGQGNRLFYCLIFLFFIPCIKIVAIVLVHIYLSIMMYKILKRYNGAYTLFIILNLLPLLILMRSTYNFSRISAIFKIINIFLLIKTYNDIKKNCLVQY